MILTVTQGCVLEELARRPRSTAELGVTSTAITGLEDYGLVRRGPARPDPRRVRLELTPAGELALKLTHRYADRTQA